MTSREEWRARAEEGLPPESAVVERNAAITARYASLYRDQPRLFKWAGMAAFGSHRVGLALSPYRITERHPVIELWSRHDGIFFDDLEQMRLTNNAIYSDIAWAHHVFVEKGFEALEALLDLDARTKLLLDGFRLVHSGRNAGDDELVWRGNELLLKHEQAVVVQAAFDRLDRGFEVFLSLTTALDFDADNLAVDLRTNSAFYLYMLTKGVDVLRGTRALPSYVRFDHRWYWLATRVFPTWRRVESREARTMEHVEKLIAKSVSVASLRAA